MCFVLSFLNIPPEKDEDELLRTIRCISIRSTHTGTLPKWGPDQNKEKLIDLLASHNINIISNTDTEIITRYRTGQEHLYDKSAIVGRQYRFKWDGSNWVYTVDYDPILGIDNSEKEKKKKKNIYDDLDDSSPQAPDYVWWDNNKVLSGRFMAFDLETNLHVPGEFAEIVLGSAATETGDAVLLTKSQILPFLKKQHEAYPTQIWCGWNIAGFDVPVMDYRIPRFREEMHDILIERLFKGYLYDTMIFTQLYDIGLYGDLYSWESKWLSPLVWSNNKNSGVYSLVTQSKRWLGVDDLSKEEQTTFWEYLEDPKKISENQAAYALADSLICACIQERLYEHPNTWKIANITNKELKEFDGTILEDVGCFDHLVRASGFKYGWQTHSTQFLGAYSLAWVSNNGIETDVDYIFDLLQNLNTELNLLFRRLEGEPGYIICKIDNKTGKQSEIKWLPQADLETAELVIDSFRKKDKEQKYDYRLDPTVQSIKFLRNRQDNAFYSKYKKKQGTQYVFCQDGSVRKKEIEEYTFEYILDHTSDEYLKSREIKRREDLSRLGLQQKEWMYFYDISNIDDIPDIVLRLNFQIATLLKKISTVKNYLPGLCSLPKKKVKVLKDSTLPDLRTKLSLDNVSKGRIHPSFRPLLATGRTGAADPNTQQVERNNKFRHCFVSAYLFYLMCADYGAAEMGTQAEIYVHRYNKKILANYINDGFDVHILTAMQFRFPEQKDIWFPIVSNELIRNLKRATKHAEKLEIAKKAKEIWTWFSINENDSGEDMAKDIWVHLLAESLLPDTPIKIAKGEIKEARQAAKPVNFGVPGGMNPPKIQRLAKTDYGLSMTLAEAEQAFQAWFTAYPEGKNWVDDGDQYLVKDPPFPYQPFYRNCMVLTGRLRGYRVASLDSGYDTGKNEWHNAQFQGLAADAAKLALYLTWREGLRQVNFVHDEIDFEVPKQRATEHQELAASRMRLGMTNVVKYVNITVGSAISERWQK